MSVKTLDAGGKLMLSGDTRVEVEVALDDLIKRGAKGIAGIQQVGRAWVAACTLPTKAHEADTTTSLSMSDFKINTATADEPEFEDGCKVEEFGFKRIVTGPSRQAVELRLAHMKRFGGELEGQIEQDGSAWTAVVDTGGADKAYKF